MLEHFKKHWKAADDEFVALDEVSRPNGAGAGVSGWTNNVVASLDFLASKKSLDIDGFKGWLLQVSGYLSKATFDKAMAEVAHPALCAPSQQSPESQAHSNPEPEPEPR